MDICPSRGRDDEPTASDEALLPLLSTAHAVALRLSRDGVDHPGIGRALGIATDAVPDLLFVAERKLAALRAGHVRSEARDDERS